MWKNKRFISIIFLVLLVSIIIVFFAVPAFINRLIDEESRELTSAEKNIVSRIIDQYYDDFSCLRYENVKKYFYDGNINISVRDGIHPTTDYERNYYGLIASEEDFKKIASNYKEHAGINVIKEFTSMEFVLQPYDYPVGNVYFVELKNKYQNCETYEKFFIQKDCLLIYEHNIFITSEGKSFKL
jgi:hypothetical protein